MFRQIPEHERDGDKAEYERKRQSWQPSASVVAPNLVHKLAWPDAQQIAKNPKPAIDPYQPALKFGADSESFYTHQCEACFAVTTRTNLHHPVPQQIRRSTHTVRLCFDCHGLIHTIPNSWLAQMSTKQQIAWLRTRNVALIPIPL